MPKSEREEVLSTLTAQIFSAMLNDLVMDATLQSRHEVARSRGVCRVCHTCCGSIHAPVPSTSAIQITTSPSRPGSPVTALNIEVKVSNGSSATGSNTPTSVKDGHLYLECVNCSRQIASSRYAPHLSSCMGLASARRGAARGNAKAKLPLEAGRSVSPASDMGNISEESPKKGKVKAIGKHADEGEYNLKRKRPVSPQVSPGKKQKKQRTSGSPLSKLKSTHDISGLRSNNHYPPPTPQSKVPSKLRDTSTASFIGGRSESETPRDSSPDASVMTSGSSFSLSQSPTLATRSNGNGKSKAGGIAPPRPSPPRPLSVHVPDYTLDVEGDETGSSTDTDTS